MQINHYPNILNENKKSHVIFFQEVLIEIRIT